MADTKTLLNQAVKTFNLQGEELTAFNTLNAKLQAAPNRIEAAKILSENGDLVAKIKTQ